MDVLSRTARRLRSDSVFTRLAVTVLGVAVASVVRIGLNDYWEAKFPFLFFFPAILISALVGGLAFGLLAIALSSLVVIFAVIGPHEPAQTVWTIVGDGGFIGFLVVGLLISVVADSQRRANQRAEASADAARSANAALQEALAKLAFHVENTPLANIEWDRDFRVRVWSKQAEELFGWSAGEVVGKHPLEFPFVHPDDRSLFEPILAALIDGAADRSVSVNRNLCKDGRVLHFEWYHSALRDADGRMTSVLSLGLDCTERQRTEEERDALLRKQSTIAESLQRSLLLTPPRDLFPGLEIASEYEPASDEAQLGGDFYDAFALGKEKVALVVGDVTGKGLEAAMYTAEIKFALRAFLREYPNPALALERLNHFIIDAQRLDRQSRGALVCVSLVVIDTTSGESRVAVGGAEPPLLIRRAGDAEEVSVSGTVVGAFDVGEFVDAGVILRPGDSLLMVTDGITEARRGSRFFGPDRLPEVARGSIGDGTDLGDAPQRILAAAREFAGGKLKDDVCILIVRRRRLQMDVAGNKIE